MALIPHAVPLESLYYASAFLRLSDIQIFRVVNIEVMVLAVLF